MNIERIKLIRKLQQDMLSFVYAHQKKTIAEKMWMIAIKNKNMLQDCNTNTFIHNSIWYSAGDSTRTNDKYIPNRILHPQLKEKVIKLLHTEFEAIQQQETLQVHFGQVLTVARRKTDLTELLPYPLHPMINIIDQETFDCGPNLIQEEIIQFKEKNKDGILCLNSMLLLELLLSK